MSMVGRRAIAGVVMVAAVASGAVIARADSAKPAAAEGGLKIAPAMFEMTAVGGALAPPVTGHQNRSEKL
mgnify:CR=1 FL=1